MLDQNYGYVSFKLLFALGISIGSGCAVLPERVTSTPSFSVDTRVKNSVTSHTPLGDSALYQTKINSLEFSQKLVQVGRYRALHAVPTLEQKDLLQVLIDVTLPPEVQDIGAAVHYLLERSGYEYAESKLGYGVRATQRQEGIPGRDIALLLTKSIPVVHRHLGPMTLQQALETLVGAPFRLLVDPVHRMVSYELLSSPLAAESL